MPRSRWARAGARLGRDRVAALGLAIIALTVAAAVLAPALSPADPIRNSLLDRLTPPMWVEGGTARHPLGTDTLGRDVASRLLHGARVSLVVGLAAVAIAGTLGVAVGLAGGYYRGWLDDAMMRVGDVQLAFPVLLLGVAVLAVLGPGERNLILVLGVSGWITYARIVRGETLSLVEREFVEAARALGAPTVRILWRHVLPNLVSPITVQGTFIFAYAVLAEAALSFLGVGVPPEIPTWGTMVAGGQVYAHQALWIVLFPGLAIIVTALSLQVLGDGIRDLLDPRLRRTA